jgi:hypothetical protein
MLPGKVYWYDEPPQFLRLAFLLLGAGGCVALAIRDVHRWGHALPGRDNPFGALFAGATAVFTVRVTWHWIAKEDNGGFSDNGKQWYRGITALVIYIALSILVGIAGRNIGTDPTKKAVVEYALSVLIYLLYIIGSAVKLEVPKEPTQASWRRWIAVFGILAAAPIIVIMLSQIRVIQGTPSADQLYSLEDWIRRLSLMTFFFLVVRLFVAAIVGQVSLLLAERKPAARAD